MIHFCKAVKYALFLQKSVLILQNMHYNSNNITKVIIQYISLSARYIKTRLYHIHMPKSKKKMVPIYENIRI